MGIANSLERGRSIRRLQSAIFFVSLYALAGLILLVTPALGDDYFVTSRFDRADINVGDGECFTGTMLFLLGGGAVQECTLRAAMEEANAHPGLDAIRFDSPSLPGGAIDITLESALPIVTDPIQILGYTAAGFTGSDELDFEEAPAVRIRPNATDWQPGVTIVLAPGSDGSLIQGLDLLGSFDVRLIQIQSDDNVIQGSYLGIPRSLTEADAYLPQSGGAVLIDGGDDNLVGRSCFAGQCTGRGNVMASGKGTGRYTLLIREGDNNEVYGNRIGTNPAGTATPIDSSQGLGLTGGRSGIVVFDLAGPTVIGSPYLGGGNLISGHEESGLRLRNLGSSLVQNNLIGTDASGTFAIPNCGPGIYISSPSGPVLHQIGGTGSGDANVISGNQPDCASFSAGLIIRVGEGEHQYIIEGNIIGLTADQTGLLPNGRSDGLEPEGFFGFGLWLSGGCLGDVPSAIRGNNIAGQGASDILFANVSRCSPGGIPGQEDITIVGNILGTDPLGNLVPNRNPAYPVVNILGGSGPRIGNVGEGNVIAHGRIALRISESDFTATATNGKKATVQGNLIGTDLLGNDLGGEIGIQLIDAVARIGAGPEEVDPQEVFERGNLIAHQSVAQIVVERDGFTPEGGGSIRGNRLRGRPTSVPIRLRSDGEADCIDGGGSCARSNDFGDTDEGANRLQNYPEFDSVVTRFNESTQQLEIRYRVDSNVGDSAYPLQVDFYLASTNFESPEIYLGSDTYESVQAGLFRSVPLDPIDPSTEVAGYLRATATDSDGNTSQMSEQLITVPEPGFMPAMIVGLLGVIGLAKKKRSRVIRLSV